MINSHTLYKNNDSNKFYKLQYYLHNIYNNYKIKWWYSSKDSGCSSCANGSTEVTIIKDFFMGQSFN